MNIGQRMRDRRIELNINPKTIADKIGKSLSTYYRYETGEIEKLTISKMCEIADILQVSPIYLLLGEEKDFNNKSNINSFSESIAKNFANQITRYMTTYKISSKSLSESISDFTGINITSKDIDEYKNGHSFPDIVTFMSISKIFDVSYDYLFANIDYSNVKYERPKVSEPSKGYNEKVPHVVNVERLFKESELSIEELSEKTGISLELITKYYNAEADEIPTSELRVIAELFSMPLVDLLFERDPRPLIEKITYLDAVDINRVENYVNQLLIEQQEKANLNS